MLQVPGGYASKLVTHFVTLNCVVEVFPWRFKVSRLPDGRFTLDVVCGITVYRDYISLVMCNEIKS